MNVVERIFCSRKVWIALAGVALSAVVVLGLDPAKWTPLITAIVGLAGTCIAAIGYEDGQEKSAGGDGGPSGGGPATPAPTRSLSASPVLAGLVALLLLSAGGCAKTPEARWAQSRDVLTQTQDALRSQHAAGALSDKDLLTIDPFVQAARGALTRARELLDQGTPDAGAVDFYLNLAEQTLARIAKDKAKVTNTKEASHADVRGNPGSHAVGPFPAGLRDAPSGALTAGRHVYARAG